MCSTKDEAETRCSERFSWVPPGRFELPTPSLGEKCSSPELRGRAHGLPRGLNRVAAPVAAAIPRRATVPRRRRPLHRLGEAPTGRTHPAYCCRDDDRGASRPGPATHRAHPRRHAGARRRRPVSGYRRGGAARRGRLRVGRVRGARWHLPGARRRPHRDPHVTPHGSPRSPPRTRPRVRPGRRRRGRAHHRRGRAQLPAAARRQRPVRWCDCLQQPEPLCRSRSRAAGAPRTRPQHRGLGDDRR